MKKTVWDVSYELEKIVEDQFGAKFDHTETIFDRSRIEKGMFFDILDLLLHMYGGEGSIEFIDKYLDLRGVNMNQISNFEEIFNEFKQLLILKRNTRIKS